jgi:lysophospholipase L1-like esterase
LSREARARALLVALSTLLALVLAEGVVRITGAAPDIFVLFADRYRLSGNGVLKYELLPGASDGVDSEPISEWGLRDRNFPLSKPDGTARIVFAGDSVAYGYAVSRERSAPKALEKKLNLGLSEPGCPERIDVLNLGVPGYGVTQVIERIRVAGLPHDPDVIVYLYVLNDPSLFNIEYDALKAIERNALADAKRSAIRILRRSQLYLIIRQALSTQDRPYQRISPDQFEELKDRSPAWGSIFSGQYADYFQHIHNDPEEWGRVRDGLAQLRSLTEPLGIPVVVAIMPLSVAEGMGDGYPFREIHAKVAAEAQRNGLRVLDLLPPFSRAAAGASGKAPFLDSFHPTPLGNAKIAGALDAWLDQQGCAIYGAPFGSSS